MRRRVSFRLECARAPTRPRAARLRRRSFREISRGFVKVFCGERASEQASPNSAKLARRLWKLMSRTVHVLVPASPVSRLIFAVSLAPCYRERERERERARECASTIAVPDTRDRRLDATRFFNTTSRVCLLSVHSYFEIVSRLRLSRSRFFNPFHLALVFLERREYLTTLSRVNIT